MDETAIALLWGERPTPRRGPRPAFDIEGIARAGVTIADADGLAAVTMQRVAESLGVTKMALYRYVPGKAALVALMVDLGIGEPPAAVTGAPWREALTVWSRALFAKFYEHPWSIEATRGARVIGPNELGWMEAAVAALGGSGLDGAETLDVVVVLTGHVRSLGDQVRAFSGDEAPAAEGAVADTFRAVLAGREDRFPAVTAAFAAGGRESQALDFGIDRILDGVEVLIASRSKS